MEVVTEDAPLGTIWLLSRCYFNIEFRSGGGGGGGGGCSYIALNDEVVMVAAGGDL